MTEELKQAAQQALEQLEFLNACYPHKTAADAIAALQSALTQRPAAQAGEREADDCDVTGQHGPLPETGWDEAPPEAFRKPSPTAGMNLGQRIKHVGGRENAAGYIEFGSVAAVRALVRQYLRDLPTQPAAQATPEPDEVARLVASIKDDAKHAAYLAEIDNTDGRDNYLHKLSISLDDLASRVHHQATPESSRGMIGMGAHALANELAQAVAQDDADPDGHDMSAGLFGTNVSAWLRKISADYLPQHATPEPVGEPDTVPLDALHAVERERDYWKSRSKAMLDHAEGTCWYWMGDGEDHLESLVNSLPVVIRADQLRELLAHPAPGVPVGWTDEQCLKFMCVALRHVEYKRGTKGPSCDDIRLGLKFALAAAQAKGGGHA